MGAVLGFGYTKVTSMSIFEGHFMKWDEETVLP